MAEDEGDWSDFDFVEDGLGVEEGLGAAERGDNEGPEDPAQPAAGVPGGPAEQGRSATPISTKSRPLTRPHKLPKLPAVLVARKAAREAAPERETVSRR